MGFRWSGESVPTSLAVYWAEELDRQRIAADARRAGLTVPDYIAMTAKPEQLVAALSAASDKLASDFGRWQTPWGDINRFQRLTDDIVHPFTDAGPSIPVAFTAARGFARFIRGPALQRIEKDLRHQRQQLRRRGRVRKDNSGEGSNRWW